MPGGGHVMVNVGTGNLLLQDDDMTVPHKGIELAFRRTYNSQSLHDVNADEGAGTYWTSPGMYGNGWTNTFDAHVVKLSPTSYSVYDIDGARYDYVVNDANNPLAGYTSLTPGQHAVFAWDGACGVTWTKPSGTTYYFYRDNPNVGCPVLPSIGGYAGRLYQIIGRNRNTSLTFSYSWDNGDASATGKVSAITVQAESGMSATMSFADVAGHRLLQQIVFPDNVTSVSYTYDANGNLLNVSRPPNNVGGARPTVIYGYVALGTAYALQYYFSPRYWAACGTSAGCLSDGGGFLVTYAGSAIPTATVSSISDFGVVNPVVSDGTTAGAIQGAGYSSSLSTYDTKYFTTGVTTATFRATDGHMTNWVVDGTGRPTQTQECTASANQGQQCTGTWLVTNETWDANNNLVSEVDPRGGETDYAHDVDGNTVALAAPAPSAGASRPTSLYSYDAFDNLIAYCDPLAAHAMQADWTSSPAAPLPGQGALCPTQSTAATRYLWSFPSWEPFGELTTATSPGTPAAPNGYQRNYAYDSGRQGGTDYGLPTSVTGAAITQNDTITPSRQPQQSFWYDINGNLVCYGSGNGQWLLGYDALGRLTSTADPDDSASGSGVCAKTGAQPNWNTTTRTSYFPDGSVNYKQTASQIANGVSTSFTYDLDGNEQTETHHYGCTAVSSCTAGLTQKFYDGADRLVEVALPYDRYDIQGYRMMTRYVYDLSQSGTTPYQGLGLPGYGNLVKTQEFLSGTVMTPFTYASYSSFTPYPISSGTWTDVRATAFDGLDRAVSSYEAAFGSQPKLANTYDAPAPGGGAQLGLLSSVTLATGEVKQYTYDGMGRLTDTAYANDGGATSPVHVRYDADSHVISRGTDALGNEALQYDGAGELISLTEPAALGSVTLTYDYYADGTRKDLGFASPVYTANPLYQYTYRPDSRRSSLKLSNGSSFTWTYTQAGRLQTQADPFTGQAITPDNYYTVGKAATRYPYYRSPLTYMPESYAYDTFGRTTGVTLPPGVFSQSTTGFDLEDGVTGTSGTSVQAPNSVTTIACAQSNVRDEKLPTYNGGCGGYLYNGAVFAPQQSALPDNQGTGPAPWTLDARAGMLKSWQGTPESSGNVSSGQFTYDASGRLTSDAEQLDRPWRASDGTMAGNRVFSTGTRTKTYDAENRLRSQQTSPATGATYLLWGESNPGGYWNDVGQGSAYELQAVDYNANSHPVRFAATYTPDYGNTQPPVTLIWLWDGNDVVAQCSYNSPSTQCGGYGFAVEGLGSYFPVTGYLAVNDRSLAGQVISRHDAGGFSGMKPTGRNSRNSFFGGVNASAAPGSVSPDTNTGPDTHGSLPGTKLALDGWTLDNNTWQGVRTYDASAGQWTTPDAYAGDVHDPMSQKPFMWNRNNPYAYSDPSGYCTEGKDGCLGGVDWPAMDRTTTAMLTVLSFIMPGGSFGRAGTLVKAGSLVADAGRVAQNSANLMKAKAVGSALAKTDIQHLAAPWFRADAAKFGTQFSLRGGDGKLSTLTQVDAVVNGKKGVAEFIVNGEGELTHSRWIPGKAINGIPN